MLKPGILRVAGETTVFAKYNLGAIDVFFDFLVAGVIFWLRVGRFVGDSILFMPGVCGVNEAD